MDSNGTGSYDNAYVINCLDKKNINIELNPDFNGSPPVEHSVLRRDILSTQTVLAMIRKKETDDTRFADYYDDLLAIARSGLTGTNPQPEVAHKALIEFQNEVKTREAGIVKNRYLKRLAKFAGMIGGPAFLLACALYVVLNWHILEPNEINQPYIKADIIRITNFFFLISGCSAGVWLSFGARRQTLQFHDLHIPEPDLLHPLTRLIFAILLTVVLSLLFQLEVLTVGIGSLSSNKIYDNQVIAWLIGILCGFSEQLLSQQVSEQATRLFAKR